MTKKGQALSALIWMYWTEVRRAHLLGETVEQATA